MKGYVEAAETFLQVNGLGALLDEFDIKSVVGEIDDKMQQELTRIKKPERNDLTLNDLPLKAAVVSDLVLLSLLGIKRKGGRSYFSELRRRFTLMELSEESLKSFLEAETRIILEYRKTPKIFGIVSESWYDWEKLFRSATTPDVDRLVDPKSLLTSEITVVLDEQLANLDRFHGKICRKGWKVSAHILGNGDIHKSPYVLELYARLEKAGFKKWQVFAICHNECWQLLKFKWAYADHEIWTQGSVQEARKNAA